MPARAFRIRGTALPITGKPGRSKFSDSASLVDSPLGGVGVISVTAVARTTGVEVGVNVGNGGCVGVGKAVGVGVIVGVGVGVLVDSGLVQDRYGYLLWLSYSVFVKNRVDLNPDLSVRCRRFNVLVVFREYRITYGPGRLSCSKHEGDQIVNTAAVLP